MVVKKFGISGVKQSQSCPKYTAVVITTVSVMVNLPVCTRTLITIIFFLFNIDNVVIHEFLNELF